MPFSIFFSKKMASMELGLHLWFLIENILYLVQLIRSVYPSVDTTDRSSIQVHTSADFLFSLMTNAYSLNGILAASIMACVHPPWLLPRSRDQGRHAYTAGAASTFEALTICRLMKCTLSKSKGIRAIRPSGWAHLLQLSLVFGYLLLPKGP
jgi:hypothetical protein